MDVKHVVVGILYKVVDSQKFYLLMSSTRDFGQFTGMLYPVGGHIEDGESVEKALEREVYEELAIRVEPINEVHVSPGDVSDQLTHWWLCEPILSEVHINLDANEVKEIRWLTKAEIIDSPHLIWPATYKFFTEILFK